MDGKNYCRIEIDWHYSKGYVDIAMPKYIPELRKKLQHTKPIKPQYAPHKWTQPVFGKQTQMALDPHKTEPLDKKGTKYIQSGVGSILYYARAVDPTMLPSLNKIGTTQAKPTKLTKEKLEMPLDYAATYPNAKIRYYASGMILWIESDAAYLVLPNARSRYAGHFYLSTLPPKGNLTSYKPPTNGPIHTECRTIKNVVASAAEAETAGLFGNAQIGIAIRRAL